MDMNSVCLCVLVMGLLFESGHSDDYSPCPDVLYFYREGKTVYGRITVQPVEVVSSLEIRLNYTILTELGEYLGELKSPEDVLLKYNRGETVQYRLHLPYVTPWPKVTEIAINGKAICTGPGDKPTSNRILSLPSISRRYYYGTGGGPPPYRRFHHESQTASQPILQTAAPQPIPQRTPQRPVVQSTYDKDEEIQKFVQHFQNSYYSASQAQQTTTTTTARPPTTTPVYVEPVTTKPRPVQRIPDTRITTADCGVIESDNGFRPLIHNGLSYERGDVPWLVAIYKINKKSLSAICGGTLVSDRHVVTAAHCMYLRKTVTNMTDIVVKIGVHELDDWSDVFTVIAKPIAVDKPESYNPDTLENDIMILTLDKRVNFTRFIRPACLWTGNTDLSQIVGNTGVVAGWGGVNKYYSAPLDEPQKVRVPIVSNKECRASASIFHQITSDKTFCAGEQNGDGPCQGDSGGGLYLKDGGKWRLRGIVSRATPSEDQSTPCNLNAYVVYTDTAQYLTWIRNILLKNYFD